MKVALLLGLVAAPMLGWMQGSPAAVPPLPMVQALQEEEERWRAIEPGLFAVEGAKRHLGTWVRCRGVPVSLHHPVTVRLASGTTVRLTRLQAADREFLASFRQPPSVAIVRGPVLAVDRATRTVTIRAVSTMFRQ